jgi:hypothetical protein
MAGTQEITLVEFASHKFTLYDDIELYKELYKRRSTYSREFLYLNVHISNEEIDTLIQGASRSERNLIVTRRLSERISWQDSDNAPIIQHWVELPKFVLNSDKCVISIVESHQRIFDFRYLFKHSIDKKRIVKYITFCNYRFICINKEFKWDERPTKYSTNIIWNNPTIPAFMAMARLKLLRKKLRSNMQQYNYKMLIANPAVPDWFLTTDELNIRYMYNEGMYIKINVNARNVNEYFENVEQYIKKCVQREVAMKSNICAILARIARLSGGRCFNTIRCIYVEIFSTIGRSNDAAIMSYYMDRNTLRR